MNSQTPRIIALFNQAGGVAKTTLTHIGNMKSGIFSVMMICQGGSQNFLFRDWELAIGDILARLFP